MKVMNLESNNKQSECGNKLGVNPNDNRLRFGMKFSRMQNGSEAKNEVKEWTGVTGNVLTSV